MSYTTIINIFPQEKIECGQEFSNAWGSAPVVWDALSLRYFLRNPLLYSGTEESHKLWDLWKNNNIPLHHRAVLMMTFDRAYITKKDYARAAEDIRKFLADFSVDTVNHWPEIATIFENDPDIPAIGFWHTSVSDNPFNNGKYDEDKDCYGSPDWKKIYDLYSELDASNKTTQEKEKS